MLNLRLVLLGGALFASAPAWAQSYQVRQGQLPYAGHTQASVNVVVDGTEDETRDFLQSYMKSSQRLSFRGGLAGLLGKKPVLAAKQVSGTSIASRTVDIYAATTALTDSTTEVALFGGFGDKVTSTYFSPDLTPAPFKQLESILTKYAPAARTNFYRQQVADAEAKIAAIDKEKEKLNRHADATRANTAANLKRIEELLRQNEANAITLSQDSVQLVNNGLLREAGVKLLERRRTRLSIVTP
ncbi:hypothetical protein QMK33_00915 [Hymenobacter sp. H14-R3]|uniref:hypothetical protein n=1 Tax=Hymenobacter sp. H14-R3 TaxID=3046308 RepID=UPI0024BA8FA5|nr:hypothetical protein [Hymenobacter sp. H14-R3]MDJ0363697.1 hypothetical protein [Hymenobacter sp. H14-R3]